MDKLLSSKILHPTGYLQTHHSQSLPNINFLEINTTIFKDIGLEPHPPILKGEGARLPQAGIELQQQSTKRNTP